MEKYDLETIIKDAWETCILNGKEKRYMITENIYVLIASYSTCKKVIDNINCSMAVEFIDKSKLILILKEQVKEDYMLFKFIIMHEFGHIVHNHLKNKKDGIKEDMKREKAADLYAMKRGNFTISQTQDIIQKIHKPYIKAAEQMGGGEIVKEILQIRLQNLNEFKS